jgi:hypothetical protein
MSFDKDKLGASSNLPAVQPLGSKERTNPLVQHFILENPDLEYRPHGHAVAVSFTLFI